VSPVKNPEVKNLISMTDVIFIIGAIIIMVAVISYFIYQINRLRMAKAIHHNAYHIKGSQADDSLHWFKKPCIW
jgi:hypothetical protein